MRLVCPALRAMCPAPAVTGVGGGGGGGGAFLAGAPGHVPGVTSQSGQILDIVTIYLK